MQMHSHENIETQIGIYPVQYQYCGLNQNICAALTNAIMQKMASTATKSNNRCYLWNTMSFQGFNNNVFTQMLSDAGNFLILQSRQNPNANLDQLVHLASEFAIESWIAVLVSQNQALQQLNAGNADYINSILAQYSQFKGNGGGTVIGGVGGAQPISMINGGNNTVINSQVRPGSIATLGSVSGTRGGYSSMAIEGVGVSGNAQQPVNQTDSFDPFGNFGIINKPSAPQQQTTITRGDQFEAMLEEIGWAPTLDQRHKPAYRASTQKIQVINNIAEVVDMNAEEHKIHTGVEALYAPTAPIEVAQEMLRTASKPALSPDEGEDGFRPTSLAEPEDQYIIDLSDACIQTTMMVNLANVNWEQDQAIDIYYRSAKRLAPLIMRTPSELANVLDFHRDAALCQTFNQVHNLFKAHSDKIPYQASRVFDSRITFAINTILSKIFSISNLSIDSFFEDIHDLMAILDRDYGDLVVPFLTRRQPEIIAKVFKMLPRHLSDTFSADSFQKADKAATFVRYLEDNAVYVHVNYTSIELDIGFDVNGSGVLSQEHTPAILAVAKTAFESYDTDTVKVFCVDGKIYTIVKSWVTNDYLIYL